MPSKKAPKKPGFAMFKRNDSTIKGYNPPNVDDDPGIDPCDYELSDDNKKKKKFTNIIQCIIDLCDFPNDLLMVEYITNKGWPTLTDVITIMVDESDNFHNNTKDILFDAKLKKAPSLQVIVFSIIL
jgi:hypothetical protein